jgi:hypothetical protein
MLPLSQEGGCVDLCLAAQTFESHREFALDEANAWNVSDDAGEREREFL